MPVVDRYVCYVRAKPVTDIGRKLIYRLQYLDMDPDKMDHVKQLFLFALHSFNQDITSDNSIESIELFEQNGDAEKGVNAAWLYVVGADSVIRLLYGSRFISENEAGEKRYVILNLERMQGVKPVFWNPGCAGYTTNVFYAGIYEESKLKDAALDVDDVPVPIERLADLLICDRDVLKSICRDLDLGDFLKSL